MFSNTARKRVRIPSREQNYAPYVGALVPLTGPGVQLYALV